MRLSASTYRQAVDKGCLLRLVQIQAKGHQILPNGEAGYIRALAMDHSQEAGQPEPIKLIHLRKRRLLRTLGGTRSLLPLSCLLLPLLQLLLRIAEVALTRHEGVVQVL